MSEETKTKDWNGLSINRLEDGGYLIYERGILREPEYFNPPMFACTTMKEALDYIKAKIGRGR